LNNILAKRSHRGLFDTASYILLDVENRKLNICHARHHGLMIRRDENILAAGKAEKNSFGSCRKRQLHRGICFSLLLGILVFLYWDRTVEPVNRQMEQFGIERIQSIQMKSGGTRKEILKEKKQCYLEVHSG
jgi:hypothetical protein